MPAKAILILRSILFFLRYKLFEFLDCHGILPNVVRREREDTEIISHLKLTRLNLNQAQISISPELTESPRGGRLKVGRTPLFSDPRQHVQDIGFVVVSDRSESEYSLRSYSLILFFFFN